MPYLNFLNAMATKQRSQKRSSNKFGVKIEKIER